MLSHDIIFLFNSVFQIFTKYSLCGPQTIFLLVLGILPLNISFVVKKYFG